MYIGLDLGTSGLRAILVDEAQSVVAEHSGHYETAHPHPGWSEQAPQLWLDACDEVLIALAQSHPEEMSHVKAIGISGHMHGAVMLDARDEPLRSCILWNDTRSAAEAKVLDKTKDVQRLSGNLVFPGFTAPKIKWVQHHEPQIFQQLKTVLLPKDYLRFWLTGVHLAEMSDAAGTSWLNVQTRQWSDQLIEEGGITPKTLPPLVEGSAPAGTIKPQLAKRWGMAETVMLVGGGADNAAAACGVGALQEGQGFVSLGTSGVVLVARDGCHPAPETAVHTFCHAVPDKWYQMGVTLAATDSLNWLSKITGQSPEQATNALGDALRPPSDIYFLPYLSGERTPHNDSKIRGAFLGLDIAHTANDMTFAVLQGVSFALRESLDALRQTGANPEHLLAIGGGSRSELWVKLLATILNVPLHLPEKGDFGAALGAARLAICGATGRAPEEVMTAPKTQKIITPDVKLVPQYEAAYQKFKQIYPLVRQVS
jgi:xylulokinase